MKKIATITAAVICCHNFTFAQKASDVLEHGIPLDNHAKILLKFDSKSNKIFADYSRDHNSYNFYPIFDSCIFLARQQTVNVYIKPWNPLNYSTGTEITFISDPINDQAEIALASILNSVKEFTKEKSKVIRSKPSLITEYLDRANDLRSVFAKYHYKYFIKNIFDTLKAMDFVEMENTTKTLVAQNSKIIEIENTYKGIKKEIDSLKKDISTALTDQDMEKHLLKIIVTEIENTYQIQMAALAKLRQAYKLVNETSVLASKNAGEGKFKWCIPLEPVTLMNSKIGLFAITIKEGGLKLSTDSSIVEADSKKLISQTIRFRRFQRFVPEVSLGIAYTNINYNTYGTVTDSTGQQYIAPPSINAIRNLNIATMLNFNYYVYNSPINPFYQVGIGINAGVPTLLTGFGMRMNINGLSRLSISGGIAMTWTQELDKLRVGDKISGTDDINKDLETQFSWPPKGYIGIQYNF